MKVILRFNPKLHGLKYTQRLDDCGRSVMSTPPAPDIGAVCAAHEAQYEAIYDPFLGL